MQPVQDETDRRFTDSRREHSDLKHNFLELEWFFEQSNYVKKPTSDDYGLVMKVQMAEGHKTEWRR